MSNQNQTAPVKKNKKNSKKQQLNSSSFLIVGIGASAGGLEALISLLDKLSPPIDAAFIIVQHLAPSHESLATEILSRKTKLPVREIKNNTRVQANHVYMIPPNYNLQIFNRVLKIVPFSANLTKLKSIDFFFESLAAMEKDKAIGVILSGTASDGTKGIKAIKKEGGVTIAQDPISAKFDEMPRNAIASGCVDLILTPQQIAKKIMEFASHPLSYQTTKDGILPKKDNLTIIFSLLRNQSHVDFTHYKYSTLNRRINRRMILCKKKNLNDYVNYLQSNHQEIHALFTDFLINVTEFFRDPDVFNKLKKKYFSRIMTQSNSSIRIWAIGCATGEEVYSIAIALTEFLEESDKKRRVQIFATDVSEAAIKKARIGLYPDSIQKNVSKERLNRYFVKVGKHYKITKFIRDLCLFSKHDITSDPPFAKLDLIFCRNLLIYFDSYLQRHVLPILHYALNPQGLLCLGRSESINNLTMLFQGIDKTNKFYVRSSSKTSMRLQFPAPIDHSISERRIVTSEIQSRETIKSFDLQHETDQLLIAEYAPPGVVINNNMEIVLVTGNITSYLKIPEGRLSFNIFKMAKLEIVSDLRLMVQAVKKKNIRMDKKNISISEDGPSIFFDISVIPFQWDKRDKECFFLILFKSVSAPEEFDLPKSEKIGSSTKELIKKSIKLKDLQIKKLNKQLVETRIYQESLSEAYEDTQEQITTANEELQSANEEFQSTNEELETAKEELQSANEELITLNDELHTRNNELMDVNSDLINLLGTIDFPIVMVGPDSKIRRFTPSAGQMLNLIPGDVGRIIGNIKSNFDGPDLETLISEVMEKAIVKEEEILAHDGRYFRLQVCPYKTIDNKIEGAVISFVDITFLKKHLQESQAALDYAISISNTLPLPLIVLDEKQQFISANNSFIKKFEIIPQKNINIDLLHILGIKSGDCLQLRKNINDLIIKNKELKNLEIEYDFRVLGKKIMLFNAQQIKWQESLPKAILLSIDDITEKREIEQKLQVYQERFQLMIDGIKDYAIFMLDTKGKVIFWNEGAKRIVGYNTQEIIDVNYAKFYSKDDIEINMPGKILKKAIKKGYIEYEGYKIRKDGSQYWANDLITVMRDASGKLTGFSVISRDSTARKKLSEQEEQARIEAEHANEAKDIFLATLSHELRNPLNAICSWSQLLNSHQFEADILKQGLNAINQSARTQAQLINDLLDISRIRSGKLSLNLNEIKVMDIVKEAIESIRFLANDKKIQIEIFSTIKTPEIYGDGDRLQQIMWNLLTNSIKFSPQDSKIDIYIEKMAR